MNPKFPVEESETSALPSSTKTIKDPNANNAQYSTLPIWVYVIFRKNLSSGHEKLNVKESLDGPVFWSRRVIYIFCCSCHFDKHEQEIIRVLEKGKGLIERVCLVDRPLDYAFLPDSFFGYLANYLLKLEFVYLRELDLEKINRQTVVELSKHRNLKKLVVHGCRNFEALQDFHNLPQLLVVKGDIVGLKAMLGDFDEHMFVDSKFDSSTVIEKGE